MTENQDGKPRCESCGNPLVQSKKFIASTYMYWNRPWGGTLKMSVPVIPFACMKCGRVFLFMSDKKKIIREFNELPEDEKKQYLEE